MPKPLPEDEYRSIYSRVPRLTVEIVITSEEGVLLSLRQIEPCKGIWHLPGGTVRFGESLEESVKRVAKSEVGIEVVGCRQIGVIEYPSHYKKGLDEPIGIAYLIHLEDFEPPEHFEWFTSLPKNMHEEQKDFLARTIKVH